MKNLYRKDISQEEAEKAIKTIITWIGEDSNREGLIDTPKRVLKSYLEKFDGYNIDPKDILSTSFSETNNYKGVITLSNIEIESTCEHHLAPIIGKTSVSYIPRNKVVGISKLARVVEVFSHRLQLQERLTSQIAHVINECLSPKGVAVIIKAKHHCICYRGVLHRKTMMETSCFLGEFEQKPEIIPKLK